MSISLTTYRLLFVSFIVMLCVTGFAQTSPIKTSISKNQILIGETIDLKVEANNLESAKAIKWLAIPDTLEHFEVVNRGKVDSVYSGNSLSGLSQTFTITSFDSGQWRLPQFAVIIQPAAGNVISYATDSFPITVSFANDTTNVIRDIKPIQEVEIADYKWYYIGAAILGVVLLALGIWWYLKNKKKDAPPLFKGKLPAYEEAMDELNQLKQMDLSTPDNLKLYHTKLQLVLKRYLSRKTNSNHLNKTTGDFLLLANELGVDNASVTGMASSLRLGDAVKFAKFIPGHHDNAQSLDQIKNFIDQVEKLTSTVKR